MIRGHCVIALMMSVLVLASRLNAQSLGNQVPLRQILIKVLFTEVTHDDSLESAEFFGALNRKESGSTSMPSSASWSALVATPEMSSALQKLSNKGKVDILSRPYVLAAENQLSTISAGSNEDVGDVHLTIDMIPHVTANGQLLLDISLSAPASNNLAPPVTSTRLPQASIAVEGGHLIILHGFAHQRETTTIAKIPVVGDLPLLGALFTGKKTTKTNVEVVVMITPSLAMRKQP